jgi:hypothetical protein
MNCNDFRAQWLSHVDEAALSHIETCDDCLNWIETAFASEEEINFMKEFPQPSADLEDRIMQTIYAANGNGVLPPLTAAQETASDPAQPAEKPRRSWWHYRRIAWISAAGILLIVGLIRIQGQLGDSGSEQAAMHSAAGAPESASPSAAPSAAASGEGAITFAGGESSAKEAPGTLRDGGPQESAASQAQAPERSEQPASPVPDMQQAPQEEEPSVIEQALIAMDTANLPQATPAARAHAERSLASRDAAGEPESENQTLQQANAKKSAAQPAGGSNQAAETNVGTFAARQESEAISMAASEEVPRAFAAPEAAGDGQPEIAEMPLTISTFTDVKLAAQVSDIPIPVLVGLPDGFLPETISLRYLSETSKHVSAVSTSYRRDKQLVSVLITRNDSPKRSLSIPGTFVDRRLFPIGRDQAIAVTHDPKTAMGKAEHEVHFITTRDNIPLYVTITGSGVSLDDLIEAARTMQWDQG